MDERPGGDFLLPRSQRIYASVVCWIVAVSVFICITGQFLAMLNVENNILDPGPAYRAVLEGRSAADVWSLAGDGFPGGHFYLGNILSGDGLAGFGIALGASAALWALLAASLAYFRERSYGYAALCLVICAFIVFAMSGAVSL